MQDGQDDCLTPMSFGQSLYGWTVSCLGTCCTAWNNRLGESSLRKETAGTLAMTQCNVLIPTLRAVGDIWTSQHVFGNSEFELKVGH